MARRAGSLALPLLAVAAVGCGGPRFHRTGPVTPSPAAPPIAIDRLALGVSNVYLITRGDAALLVDSGGPGDRGALADALAARGVPPAKVRAVVITHGHADHAGSARWLQTQGAAIVLGAGDAGPAGRGENERLSATGLLAALVASVFMDPFEPFTADLTVDHELDLGAYGFPELRVVPVPGHTPGSIAVLVGDEALVGDMLKGGELFRHAPTEHLYHADRLADHRALEGLLARGVRRLYPGHRGPLDGDAVRAWLPGAEDPGRATALSLDLEARGELGDGGDGATGGLRLRYAIGRAGAAGLGYALGADLRAGYLGRAEYEADAFPLGLAARSAEGGLLMLAVGAGIGGPRGNAATHALAELAVELPAGPLRVIARGAAGLTLGGAAYASETGGGEREGEVSLLAGVRLGRDARWGAFVAGKGPFLALSFRDLGGDRLLGLVLGLDLFAGR